MNVIGEILRQTFEWAEIITQQHCFFQFKFYLIIEPIVVVEEYTLHEQEHYIN